ncbi:MAG: gamma-glutamyltransferase [Planctomycetota bacterium]|nr:gamma-glutamyltransferase [Planctomycetota bacterium]
MTHGACASGDPHSAKAGADILKAGGNAVDATVAAGLVAAVTQPTMTSLGGGGILTLRVDGRVIVCDCFSTLPGINLRKRGERELDVVTVSFEGIDVDFRVRAPSIAVPGTVAGLWETHARYGRLPLAEVAAPAVQAARYGYRVTEAQGKAFNLLGEIYRMTPQSWALLSNGRETAEKGELLRNPDIADTIEQLVEEGAQVFYTGDIGRAITTAAEGWLTPEDLAAYKPIFREPLLGTYRGWVLYAPAIPSVTGGMLFATLRALDDEGPLPRDMKLGDWRRLVDAMLHMERVRTEEYEERLFEEGYLQSMLAACPGGNTMHISAADEDGNIVAYTTTVGESAGIVAPGTGVILNNFLGEEDIYPGTGDDHPGRRMMSSMCPLIADDGQGRSIALGSAGSARIKTAILQILVHLIDGGVSPREAVRRSRVHAEGDTLYIEGWGRTRDEVSELKTLAEKTESTWDCGFFFGGAQVVEHTSDGFRTGADEDRRGCVAYVV